MSSEISEKPKAVKYKYASGCEVFHWPEFQALAKRLMIDIEAPVVDVSIDIPLEGVVTITTETRGLDKTEER